MQKSKILIIEDHPDVLTVMTYLLQSTGCKVVTAQTGAEGMKLARAGDFDLITLDVVLPDISGFEVCRRLKQDPRLNGTPLIFISGRLDEENRRRGFELGAADFIDKPFDAVTFVSKVFFHLKPAKSLQNTNVSEQPAAKFPEQPR